MSKKDLSDLIREEAQKAPTSTNPDNKPQKTDEPTSAKSTSTRRRRTTANQSNPSDEVKILKADLEASEQGAKALQEKINALEAELEAQKNLAQTLQSKLQQTTQVEAELEEQRKIVEKIYLELDEQKQLVTKLYAELQTIEPEKKVEQPQPKSANSSTQLIPQSTSKTAIQYRPSRPIASNNSETNLSDDVIGWFD
jgi:predicted RNase H-like nuclease (RuvC/YqgF family)